MRILADGRGRNKKALAEKNYRIIKAWIIGNRDKTISDCAKETGFSYKTVLKHAKRYKEEFLNEH